jgi:fumarate reductase iron-sulfur subunit
MKINIIRTEESEELTLFDIKNNCTTALDALNYIKENIDESLAFRSGCKSGICGSCSILINDKEELACKCKIKNDDTLKPLRYTKIIKDLVVELTHIEKLLDQSKTYITENSDKEIYKVDEKLIDTQSNCILCQSCYSSCPVYEVNKEFKGPYALTRVLRYINDKKESNINEKLDVIQKNGIWDCTLCGNCTIACPQFIDPKTDIMNLRMKSVQNGYSDPSFDNNNFLNEFNNYQSIDTGFNPNSF